MRKNHLRLQIIGALAAFLAVVLFDIQTAVASDSAGIQCGSVFHDLSEFSKISKDEIAAVLSIKITTPAENPKFERTSMVGLEVMTNPVNQIFWQRIAELINPYVNGKTKIKPKPSSLVQEDNAAVESITRDEAQKWIRALNWLGINNPSALKEVIPDHWQGDTYRLPTQKEWDLIAPHQSHDFVHWVESRKNFAASKNSYIETSSKAKSPTIGLRLIRESGAYETH